MGVYSLNANITNHGFQSLFGGTKLFGSSWALLPEVARDGEGVNTHGHGFGRDDSELLAVRAVLVNGLYHLGRDDAGSDAGQTYHLFSFRVHGVNCSELAAGVSEEDEEMIGSALLHFLYNLVFLRFVDLASQAAASDGIVDDELVGLKARLLV